MTERLDTYFARANQAYYATHDPFADFTTAPEISQMFGELLAAWVAVVWRSLGAPSPVLLVEAGPGRGTLMQDVLRTVAHVAPDCRAAAQVHLVDNSPRLRAEQARRVPDATQHAAFDSLPDGYLLLLANEFLDALPIRQFVRTPAGWAERHVSQGGFVELAAQDPGRHAEPGDVVEISEAALAWTTWLAARLVRQGGAALILDYGTAHTRPGDSLQALRHGRPTDPLSDPGSADLTAHVDFQAVSQAALAQGAAVWGPVGQGIFLERLGLSARAAQLSQSRPDQAEALRVAARRLAAPERMGALFKVLCIAHPDCPEPPGFTA
jgi:SAM-dependent MidA family methyltransferase